MLSVWYSADDGGIYGDAAGHQYFLANSSEFDANREVHHVAIAYYSNHFNQYESDIIEDIEVSSRIEATITTTSTSTNSPSSSPGVFIPDGMMLTIAAIGAGTVVLIIVLFFRRR